jgi:hypothetical protein
MTPRMLYLDEVKRTQTAWDVIAAIDAYRRRCPPTRDAAAILDASLGRPASR